MKILCLHGAGTSAAIMERQLADFTDGLDQSYEWVYVDGDLEASKAKELDRMVPGPFYCYYKSIEPERIRGAIELLACVVEEEGPFDGIVGFSQGASVALSYLMDLEINNSDVPLPFKWGVFFNSIVAASPDVTFMEKEIRRTAENLDTSAIFEAMAARESAEEVMESSNGPTNRLSLMSDKARQALVMEMTDLIRVCMMGATDRQISLADISKDLQSGKKTVDEFPRVFHPTAVKQRIRMPTIHVVGKKENVNLSKQSRLMSKLCAQDSRVFIEHSGGHDIPRLPQELAAVVGATEKMIQNVQWYA